MNGELRLELEGKNAAQLRFVETEDAFELELLLVPAPWRGRGAGTALLERLFALADAAAKPVHTRARPIGSSTPAALERLVSYYERLGFAILERQVSSVTMRRAPRRG